MSLQQERIDKGLCPRCGKEAAPYYLCGDCRDEDMFRRLLRHAEKHGCLSVEKRGREKYYSLGPVDFDDVAWWPRGFELSEGDKRFRPRLRGVPVDVERTLIELFRAEGKPLTMEEIYAAWGRLRAGRERESIAADLKTIIAADRKRKEKQARRAARHAKAAE